MKTTFAVNWQYGVASHPGWFRMVNEDRSLLRIGSTHSGEPYAVAVIADGMGGSGDGEKASEVAIDIARLWLDEKLPALLRRKTLFPQLNISIEQLFYEINQRLIRLGEDAGTQIGTTLTLLFLLNETYYICHIGDCRIYKANHKLNIHQLTRDQSWIFEQVRKGRLSKQKARTHPRRHILMHCLGYQKKLNLVQRTGFFTEDHLFLLCSDGFYDRLPDPRIERYLQEGNQEGQDLQQMSDMLIDRALDKRSNDNISVILVRSLSSSYSFWERLWYRTKNFHMLFPVQWRK
ncbi:PP2C family protein-serine/threonine phosphatase [Paenibacillus agricola]|uniref:Serine/threonine-protein phosphatase n=1 Tax=Paenibacillus agricola TaxID=2716264 RepID=A0ABX0J3I1_9BACL|nr:PP2C family serine/threonine-protein phosphatase [Paenibacillus agricola]NHN30707.1 serine/threonine-protein phosphatase [Paenibacillus agricola]